MTVLSLSGSASAELLTYEFTAVIDNALDPTAALPFAVGDTISGTFSYDTSTPSDGSDLDLSGGDLTYSYAGYPTGSIDTNGVVLAGTSGQTAVQDYRSDDGTTVMNADAVDIFSFGTGIVGTTLTNAMQHIGLFGGDAFSGAGLPETLSFLDFSGTAYELSAKLADGSQSSLMGRLLGFSLVTPGDPGDGGAASVPELSGDGATGSLALLLGVALLAMSRRRDLQAL